MREALLAGVLLVGAFFANVGWRWLESERFSTYAIFYMMQQSWVVILCLTNVIFISVTKRSLSRDVAILACGIGAVQGFKDAICRFFITDPKLIPVGVDVGDFLTGLPLQTTLIAIYSLLLAYILHEHHKQPR